MDQKMESDISTTSLRYLHILKDRQNDPITNYNHYLSQTRAPDINDCDNVNGNFQIDVAASDTNDCEIVCENIEIKTEVIEILDETIPENIEIKTEEIEILDETMRSEIESFDDGAQSNFLNISTFSDISLSNDFQNSPDSLFGENFSFENYQHAQNQALSDSIISDISLSDNLSDQISLRGIKNQIRSLQSQNSDRNQQQINHHEDSFKIQNETYVISREEPSLMESSTINDTTVNDDGDADYVSQTLLMSIDGDDESRSFKVKGQNYLTENSFLVKIDNIMEQGVNDLSSSESPPAKRRKIHETQNFFLTENLSCSQLFRQSNAMNTKDLFANETNQIFDMCDENLKSSITAISQLSATVEFESESCDERELENSSRVTMLSPKITNFNDDSANSSTISGDFEASELAVSMMKGEEVKLNTFYQTRYLMKTNEALIASYYKVKQNCDWKAISGELVNLMEPSFDYLQYKYDLMPIVTVGKRDEKISIARDSNSIELDDTIEETLEEIREAFKNPRFICSTPEQDSDVNNLNRAFTDLSFLDDDEQFCSENKRNETESIHVDEIKESIQPNWSELTHVSCSINPDAEPQFDLTTIFNFDVNLLNIDEDEGEKRNETVDEDYEADKEDENDEALFKSRCDESQRMNDLLALVRNNDFDDYSLNDCDKR